MTELQQRALAPPCIAYQSRPPSDKHVAAHGLVYEQPLVIRLTCSRLSGAAARKSQTPKNKGQGSTWLNRRCSFIGRGQSRHFRPATANRLLREAGACNDSIRRVSQTLSPRSGISRDTQAIRTELPSVAAASEAAKNAASVAVKPKSTRRGRPGTSTNGSKQFFNHPIRVNTLWRTYQVAEGCGRVCNKEDKPRHASSAYRDRPSDLLRDSLRTMRLGILCRRR